MSIHPPISKDKPAKPVAPKMKATKVIIKNAIAARSTRPPSKNDLVSEI
jgi:hypothetical protein